MTEFGRYRNHLFRLNLDGIERDVQAAAVHRHKLNYGVLIAVTKSFSWERAPFELCWQCKAPDGFGILSAGGDVVTKRCRYCRYSHDEELPALNKRVIYLDQFVFSELHKLRSNIRKADKWTSFWIEVQERLKKALLLQQLVLPHSDIHHAETIVSPFARELVDTQEHIGGDIRLMSTDDVRLRQIDEFARAFFACHEPVPDLSIDEILADGNRNDWLPIMRVSVGMDWSHLAPATREERSETHREVEKLVENWKVSGEGFDEVLEREFGAYLTSRTHGLIRAKEVFEQQLAQCDPFAMLNFSQGFPMKELQLVRQIASKSGICDGDLSDAYRRFGTWPANRLQPFDRIYAYMFAALASQFKGGRTKLPSPGLLNDISAIAAYAPYVDAMFIDNECAELLRHGRLPKELNYRATIFSLNKADAFLEYLDDIIAQTPEDVREMASAIYGVK